MLTYVKLCKQVLDRGNGMSNFYSALMIYLTINMISTLYAYGQSSA